MKTLADSDRVKVSRGLLPGAVPRRRQAVLIVLAAHAAALVVGLVFRAAGVSLANTLLVFLVAVAAVGFLAGRRASIAAAVLAVLSFNFFFTQPVLTLAVDDLEMLFTFAVLLVTGLMVSELVSRLREEAARAREQADVNSVLYRVAGEVASTSGSREIAERACSELMRARATEAVVFLAGDAGAGIGAAALACSPVERRASEAAWRTAGEAGCGTPIESEARALHVVLPSGGETALGALGIVPHGAVPTPGERRLVRALAAQIALALARERHAAEAHRVAVEAETERLRADLLSSVSHDLRTPLAAISGSASAMVTLEAILSVEDRMELCKEILAESMRLTRTVENLLQLGRLEEGRVRLTKDGFPLEELIEDALTRLSKLCDVGRIQVELPAEPPIVSVDADLVVNLLINLLDNALRYAPEGRVAVVVEVGEDSVFVTVRDGGPGLPPDSERLFERFTRGEGARRVRGSGLGLAICRAIANAHGGRLTAGPGPNGVGASFRFELPLDHELRPEVLGAFSVAEDER